MTPSLLTSIAVVGIAWVGLAAAARSAPAQDADIYNKRGVYVETDKGLEEMRSYAEARPLHDDLEVKAYRYVIPPTLQVPRAKAVGAFVINMPGNRAEAWVAASQLLFIVGREIEERRSNTYLQMTPKVSRLRPSVYLVQSPQFQGTWLGDRYIQILERAGGGKPPGYVALIVQDANGQPRKMYPVQLFGE